MLKYINIGNILLADNINKTIYKNILDLNLLNNSNMLIDNNDIRNNKYDDKKNIGKNHHIRKIFLLIIYRIYGERLYVYI